MTTITTLFRYMDTHSIEEIIAYINEQHLNLNEVDSSGQTIAHRAVYYMDVSPTNIIEILHKIGGIDWNQADNKGQTPAHLAVAAKTLNAFTALSNIGSIDWNKTDNQGNTSAHIAVNCQSHFIKMKTYPMSQVIGLLSKIDGINWNIVNHEGNTPALLAINYDSSEAIDALRQIKDIDWNKKDKNGSAPVHLAAQYDFPKCMLALSKIPEVNFNCKESDILDNTAAHYLAQNGSKKLWDVMSKIPSIDWTLTNHQKETPAYSAIWYASIAEYVGSRYDNEVLEFFKQKLTKSERDQLVSQATRTKNNVEITKNLEETQKNIRDFEKRRKEIQDLFIASLENLHSEIKNHHENNPISKLKFKTLYFDLWNGQVRFFRALILKSTPKDVEAEIADFRKLCKNNLVMSNKIMGHNWLYRLTEIVIKAVAALFAGIGMILGSFVGQGLVKSAHRQKFANTFFTLNKTKAVQALDEFKQEILGDEQENLGLLSYQNFISK